MGEESIVLLGTCFTMYHAGTGQAWIMRHGCIVQDNLRLNPSVTHERPDRPISGRIPTHQPSGMG